MGWTTPPDWSLITLPGVSDFNTYLSSNLTYVFSGRPLQLIQRQGSSDYTTTSGTFADVDTSNLSITLTLNSGRAEIHAEFWAEVDSTANNVGDFRILMDGTTASGNSNGSANVPGTRTSWVNFTGIFTGLSVGSHTFRLQWRSRAAGGTTTIRNNAYNINFWGREF